MTKMEVFLVGGAIRNNLLRIDIADRDWVVVGSSPQEMIENGYHQVGKDFPVFLHPETREECALARREIARGEGSYTSFKFITEGVTLEEDLHRRDLTINAIAEDEDGNFIDPLNGRADLKARLLRHCSESFSEDPLRVLRVARFAAQLAEYGFKVHPDTIDLMSRMSAKGMLSNLTPEQVMSELRKALMGHRPSEFFEVLDKCGSLTVLFPELHALKGVKQPKKWHPEIDTYIHTMLCVDRAAELNADFHIRYAALLHDLGKALTPKELLPSHPGHEKAGIPLVKVFNERIKASNKLSKFSELVCEHHLMAHKVFEMSPSKLHKLYCKLNAFNQPQMLSDFMLATQCDAQGRHGLKEQPYPNRDFAIKALKVARSVDRKPHIVAGNNELTQQAVRLAEILQIDSFKNNYQK